MTATAAAGRAYYYNPERGPDRRVRPEGVRSKTWKCTNVQAIHHEIVRLLHKCYSNRHIAQELNISEQMVSNVKNSPAVKTKLKILEKASDAETVDVRKMILEKAAGCVTVMHELMDKAETTPALKVRIAMDQLDRAGFAPVRQIESKNLHAHRFVTEEVIAKMKARAIELGVIDGSIIDQEED